MVFVTKEQGSVHVYQMLLVYHAIDALQTTGILAVELDVNHVIVILVAPLHLSAMNLMDNVLVGMAMVDENVMNVRPITGEILMFSVFLVNVIEKVQEHYSAEEMMGLVCAQRVLLVKTVTCVLEVTQELLHIVIHVVNALIIGMPYYKNLKIRHNSF